MHSSRWTVLDIIFTAIILVSTGFAVIKGLMREIISLVVLIGGFFLAAYFYHAAASPFADLTKTEAVADLIGFLLIFLTTLTIGAVMAWLASRLIKMASLEWIDRLMGGVFGFLRGWAVCSVIALALVAFPARQELFARSILAPYLLAGARGAVLLVPTTLKVKFHEEYQKILQSWNQDRSTR